MNFSIKRTALRIFFLALALIALGGALYVSANYNADPLSPTEVSDRVDRLNEGAAVKVPHFSLDSGRTRAKHVALFLAVERGEQLSDEDSVNYRVIYQQLLQEHQTYLRFFDRDLTVLHDLSMASPNNVRGLGVRGGHDHHDASARANFRNLSINIDTLRRPSKATSAFVRVRSAILAYKDLTDILLHLATAPQTKSVPYSIPLHPAADEMELTFETLLKEFKLAQFQPVNSPGYREHIVLALDCYDKLVLQTQSDVYGSLGPLERTLSGRWGGWQSLGLQFAGPPPTRLSRKSDSRGASAL